MSELTHCGHGKSYKDDHCAECETVWAQHVTLPEARAAVANLLKFYNQETLIGLLFTQAHHVEKLQAKLPKLPDLNPSRVREG